MNRSSKNILKYFIEFLIVAFGVFLGVYVSEWKSQKKIDENTERTLAFIIEEIESNIGKMETSIEYQSVLIQNVDSLMASLTLEDVESIFYKQDKFKLNQIPNYEGLRFAKLENIMFESAKINGVLQELNISTTQLIARLYQKQKSYVSFSDQLNSSMLNINSESKVVDLVRIFELVKYDGLNTEKWLLEELNETKENLEKVKLSNTFRQ